MAKETGGTHIFPSHQADLLITSVELRKQDPVWMVLVRAQTKPENRDNPSAPEVSIHYYCESHLAPRPGCYIRIYVEGQKEGIPHDELTTTDSPPDDVVNS